jgi:hypothetical protein
MQQIADWLDKLGMSEYADRFRGVLRMGMARIAPGESVSAFFLQRPRPCGQDYLLSQREAASLDSHRG